eukprot:500510-Hanusia_phi.AAC.3
MILKRDCIPWGRFFSFFFISKNSLGFQLPDFQLQGPDTVLLLLKLQVGVSYKLLGSGLGLFGSGLGLFGSGPGVVDFNLVIFLVGQHLQAPLLTSYVKLDGEVRLFLALVSHFCSSVAASKGQGIDSTAENTVAEDTIAGMSATFNIVKEEWYFCQASHARLPDVALRLGKRPGQPD